MLAAFRHPRLTKVTHIIFGLIALMMVIAPITSLFQKSSQNNPVIFRGSARSLALSDVFQKDQGRFIQMISAQSQQSPYWVSALVQQYLKTFVYEDFRQKYELNLSDELAWTLFIEQLGHQLDLAQYQSLNEAIIKNFGSRKNFLADLKTQLILQSFQNTIAKLTLPTAEHDDVSHHHMMRRYFSQYSFSPRDFEASIPLPSENELRAYYEAHLDQYYAESGYSFDAALIEPRLVDLSKVSQYQIFSAKEQLQSLGFADTEIQFSDLQDRICEKMIFDLQDQMRTTPLTEAVHTLKDQGISLSSQHVFHFDTLTETDLKEFFEGSDQAYAALIQQAELENQSETISVPTERGVWLIRLNAYHPEEPIAFEQVSYRVQQDWLHDQAADAAQKAAYDAYQDYVNNQNRPIGATVSQKALVSDFVMSDYRIPQNARGAVSGLLSTEYSPQHSSTIISHSQSDGASFMILDRIEEIDSENLSSEELQFRHSTLKDMQQISYQRLGGHSLDQWLNKNFEYQIEPAFWKIVTSTQSHQPVTE